MRTLAQLRQDHGPLPWRRALQIGHALATHPFEGTPALTSSAISIDDGDRVHVTALRERAEPEQAASVEACDDPSSTRDSAVALWESMQRRAPTVVWQFDRHAYMAPEQLMGKPTAETSHVYSIGVIVYELLTARMPFADAHARGFSMLITAQLKQQPVPPSTFAPVPTGVDELVLRCLHKDRRARYGDLASLATALADQLASR